VRVERFRSKQKRRFRVDKAASVRGKVDKIHPSFSEVKMEVLAKLFTIKTHFQFSFFVCFSESNITNLVH
jgi:hypothetical protein